MHHLPVFKLGYIFLLLSCNESLIFDLLKMENVEKCVCFQDKVLHNIMSIFTFMGANVMRRHGFSPWSGEMPHASGQVSQSATATEAHTRAHEPRLLSLRA